MRILGFEIGRRKAAAGLQSPNGATSGGWWPIIREPFSGAWQRGLERRVENVTAFHAVYSCVTLIASDVAKCRIKLVEQDSNGIWNEISATAFSPVLRKPNRYQNRIKFVEQWIISKLIHGNAYILKQRDNRGVVVALYVLDPTRTRPLVAPDGAVYYQLSNDNLAGIGDQVIVPQSEIIHDVMVPLYHPLCGVSPLTACGLAAIQGLAIQNNSARFFSQGARPGGVLTAPGRIEDDTAKRLKDYWETNFSGENSGRVAVLGDGLKYEAMVMKSTDAQLIEQLKWTGETVCACFHVPGYKVGVGQAPAYNNIEALDQQYYAQCLQKLFECVELLLDEGLGLVDVTGKSYGTEFDLDDLLRMDTATMIEAEKNAVSAGIKKPNESRKRMNLPPVPGGDSPYLQQQNYSLAALAKRDAKDDPFAVKFGTATQDAPPPPVAVDAAEKSLDDEAIAQMGAWSLKSYLDRLAA